MADKKRKPSIFDPGVDKQLLRDLQDRAIAIETEKRRRKFGDAYPDRLPVKEIDKMEQSYQGTMKKLVQQAGFSGIPQIIMKAPRTETGQRAVRMRYHPNDIYAYTPVQRRPKPVPARRVPGKGMMSMGAGLGIGQLLRSQMNKEQPSKTR